MNIIKGLFEKHACVKCKNYKKDVKGRTVIIHKLDGYNSVIKNVYYCDECANNKYEVHIYEDIPEDPIDHHDPYNDISSKIANENRDLY